MPETAVRTAAAVVAPVDTDRHLTPAARQAVEDGIPDSTRRATAWCADAGRRPGRRAANLRGCLGGRSPG